MIHGFLGAHGAFLVTRLISRFISIDPPGGGFSGGGGLDENLWYRISKIPIKSSTPKSRAASHLLIFY
jgi:pimeloyl-ACP methyl ester carboxylesterase